MTENSGSRSGFLKRAATGLCALAAIGGLYGFARLPKLSDGERATLARRFSFAASEIPLPPGAGPERYVRPVHPSFEGIASWISSVGAGVALADLDADGLPNDLCSVDPRVDRTIVEPAPETGARYAPFFLDALTLPYDPSTMAPMGCLPGDFNEDGRRDLLVYYWGRTPIVFLRRAPGSAAAPGGEGPPSRESFEAVEAVAPAPGATPERWYTNALSSADVDGDGHLDLIVGNYFQDGSRVIDPRAGGRESMQSSMSRGMNGGRNRLLLFVAGAGGESPTVAFSDVAGAFADPVALGWTLALGAVDLDGDMLPEIYFANDFGPDRLLHNRSTPGRPRFALLEGKKGFTTPTSKVLGHDSFKGMGIDFADLNGDGRPDIYVSNIAAEWALQESHFVWLSEGDPARMKDGVAPYRDASEPLGLSRSNWGWDARFADFDNDGVPEALQATGFVAGETNRWPEMHELAIGNDNMLANPYNWLNLKSGDDLSGHHPTPFFVRADSGGKHRHGGRYFDLGKEVGNGDVQVSRGIAIADVDGDGRLDYAVANQWQPSRFYRNRAPAAGRFLALDLVLPGASDSGAPGPGSPAIGARVSVETPEGRRLVADVDGGTGHSGKRDPGLHFGLGAVAKDARLAVDIAWRDRAGKLAHRRLELKPGRHRIVLDSGAATAASVAQTLLSPAS